MAFTFNVCEIFQMAEQIERKGAAFYRNVVKNFDDPGTRKVLLEPADREEKHADAFTAIRKSRTQRECPRVNSHWSLVVNLPPVPIPYIGVLSARYTKYDIRTTKHES